MAQTGDGSESDVPLASPGSRALVLAPSLQQLPTPGEVPDDDAPRGHTVLNGPGEAPDPEALNEYRSEITRRKVEADLRFELGADKARNGLAPRYFTRVEKDLRDELDRSRVEFGSVSPLDRRRELTRYVVGTILEPAQRYGATGSPFASPDEARELDETALGRSTERGAPTLQTEEWQRDMAATMQSLGASDALQHAAHRRILTVVVALEQDGSGALAGVSVVQGSKDPGFDEWIIHLTRKVFREHGDPNSDELELPYVPDGWHSEWRFTYEPPSVRVKLLRIAPGHAAPMAR